ncbi:MAG: GTP-binding protein, partial [Proteobacteria bacterium]
LSSEQIGETEAILRRINPSARNVRSQFGRVPLHEVLSTGRFNFDRASQNPGWLQEARGEHVPETLEYGIGSFVYRARRPFHPARLWQLLNGDWDGVLRSKGYFWLASRPDETLLWSQAGADLRVELAGYWYDSLPRDEWDAENAEAIESTFVAPHGDRRQELVFIGQNLDENLWCQKLNACLLSDAEMALYPASATEMADPFPSWEFHEVL